MFGYKGKKTAKVFNPEV